MIRMRGNEEPERSWGRIRELEKFTRKCEATVFDHGHVDPESNSTLDPKSATKKHTELLRAVDTYREEYDALVHSWGR